MNHPSERSPEIDELLAQAGWMRSLARGLIRDPFEAEDVVQDAWVLALEKRAAVRVDVASWLRRVVRNLALRRASREGRRPEVEQRLARAEATGEARDAVERMELQHWLAQALLGLDEPYRSAVILRHVEGLDPGEIARRQGCSREAARQRIARGLERLRGALDQRHGGRERWCLVLAPWITRQTGPLQIPWTSGGILMGSKAVLGSLAALGALALVWLALDRQSSSAGRERTPASANGVLPQVLPADPGAPGEAATVSATREPLASAPPSPAPAPEAPLANPLFARLLGRVVDGASAPLAGAEVVVRRPESGHFSMLDLDVRRSPKETGRAITDASGRFSFVLERGIPFDLAVAAAGFCDELLSQRYAGEELEVVLTQGFLVHGVVTRERDGAPIGGARVRVFQMNHSAGGERITTTAVDGSYELRFTFREDATLEVTPRREMSSGWYRLELGPDGTVRQDLVLADGIEVRGRVVEAGTGAPIEGARVGEGWTFERSAATDALGEYVLSGFGAEGVNELHAKAPGFGKSQRANLPATVDGVMRADFELPRGRGVRGRVLDSGARPIEGAYVGAVASEFGAEGQRTDWISGHTDRAGRFELGGLSPELRHCLLVSAEGFATQVYDFPPNELAEPELELDDVRLAPPAVLAGTVQDEEGHPLGGMEVTLTGANRDRGRFRSESGLGPEADWYVDSRVATSDAQGRFWLGALAAGEYRLSARSGGQPEGPTVELSLAEGELRDGFALLYPRGEAIRGSVVDEDGHGLGGVYVITRLRAARSGAPVDRESGQASKRTDSTGAFELSGLPPGEYQLDLHPFELESDPDRPWLSTSLEKVESGADPLRIVLPRGVSIRGRLVDPAGAALVGYTVLGTSSTSTDSPGGSTGEDGSFLLEVRPGTVWDLQVRGAPQTDAWETIFHTEPAVPAGTRELLLRVDPRSPAPPGSGDEARTVRPRR